MPAKTNNFQRIVKAIQDHLGSGATVTESKFLVDTHGGDSREVDVVVEGTFCGQSMVLSFECRDHKRVGDVQWVEQMQSKHSRLPTNLLTLISRSGFSRQAEKVAALHSIRLMKFEDVDSLSPERLFAHTNSLWSKIWTGTPTRVVIQAEQGLGRVPENVLSFPDAEILCEGGQSLGEATTIINVFLREDFVQMEMLRSALPDHRTFRVIWPSPATPDGRRFCLAKLGSKTLCPILQIDISGSCEIAMTEVPLNHGKLGATKVAWGSFDIKGKTGVVVSTRSASNSETTTVQFE